MSSSPDTDPFSGSIRLLLVFAAHESTAEFLEVRQQIDARSGELSDRDMIVIGRGFEPSARNAPMSL